LAPMAARLLRGAKVTAASGGARVAALSVRNLEGLVRQVLAWGPEAEIVEPDEGRVIAREMLRKLRPGPAADAREALQ
ncbi:MAG TPA: WYL domain-containing protein, partial [Thermoanaerobaculia bacterium]|nr:WYL domain-containing protein [Thermoanaerobaculia bacterium]